MLLSRTAEASKNPNLPLSDDAAILLLVVVGVVGAKASGGQDCSLSVAGSEIIEVQYRSNSGS